MEEVDKEISEMKLTLNARARTVAESYLMAVCTPYLIGHHVDILYSSTHRELRINSRFERTFNNAELYNIEAYSGTINSLKLAP